MYLRKCTVYGATHSEASDWRKKYEACGLYNKPWSGKEWLLFYYGFVANYCPNCGAKMDLED